MPAFVENATWDWKRSVFIPVPKKGNAKECSNYHSIALISHASRIKLTILQASLQQYMNQGLPYVQGRLRKYRGTRDQISNTHWIIEKAREFRKYIFFCIFDNAKAFDCVDHKKMWKILQEMGIPDHPTCLLKNLCAGQGATVRTGHGTTDWFQIGKGVHRAVYCHPAYLMQSTESEELKSLLMEVREESEEPGLKLNFQKTKIMACGPINSWQIDGETMETVTDFIFLASKITADGDCSHEIKRCLLPGRKAVTILDSILKRRDITLPTKVLIVKAMAFLVVMYGCENWTIKNTECQRIDAFEMCHWRRLLRVPGL